MLNGIDISTYQTTTPDLTGLSFVWARATYGTSTDARYAQHAADVRHAGLVLGAYHYWQLGDAAAQVAAFLSVARGADLLAIDLEGADSGTSTAHSQVSDMIARLHSAGRKVGLYHSLSGYPSLGQDYDWVAYWGTTPPPMPWAFWQYRGAPLDLDHYNGDLASLQRLAGVDVIHTKPAGSIGTATYAVAALALCGTTDPKVRAMTVAGQALTVSAALNLVTPAGVPVDVDGKSPPVNNRDQVYLVQPPGGGIEWFALRGDVTFTPTPVPDVAAAHAAGYAEAKQAAIAAVEGI